MHKSTLVDATGNRKWKFIPNLQGKKVIEKKKVNLFPDLCYVFLEQHHCISCEIYSLNIMTNLKEKENYTTPSDQYSYFTPTILSF